MLDQLNTIFFWLLVAMGLALLIAVIGLALMWRQISNLRVPHEAGFFATMHYIPLPLVILLDLLDFGLDIFAAPISWLLLDRLGLRSLRNKAAIEALIPFTQPIPTFTIAWVAARTLKLDDGQIDQVIEASARPSRPRLP
jgi:hypothetical protein